MYAIYALLCLSIGFQDPSASLQDASPVHYTIHPVPGGAISGELVELQIAMRFSGSASGTTVIRLPRDNYGTPRLHEFVHDIRASVGVTVEPGSRPELRLLTHEPRAEVTLAYSMTFDPTQREGSAYRPSVGASHFHFLGPQWQARVEGEGDVQREFTFAFQDLPPGWTAFGSFGVGEEPHRIKIR